VGGVRCACGRAEHTDRRQVDQYNQKIVMNTLNDG
jgi:hypothetical protein